MCMIIMTKRVTVLQYYSFLERHILVKLKILLYIIYILYIIVNSIYIFFVVLWCLRLIKNCNTVIL